MRPRSRPATKRRRLAPVVGVLAAITALLSVGVTSAAFSDTEWAALGGGTGISTGTYDLRFSHAETGPWSDADADDPIELSFGDAELTPGGTALRDVVWVKNAGDYRSSLVVTVDATTEADLLADLTMTVAVGDAAAVELTPEESTSLPNLAAGESARVTFTVALDEVDSVPSGTSLDLDATFTGQSIANAAAPGSGS